jgi:hypothetical protein
LTQLQLNAFEGLGYDKSVFSNTPALNKSVAFLTFIASASFPVSFDEVPATIRVPIPVFDDPSLVVIRYLKVSISEICIKINET